MVVFYGMSFLLTRFIQQQSFLSKWMLVSASLSFGLSVALIGQIYNSHADSYLLFLIWLIPVLLFSVITKYQPFFVLSYLLVLVTIYFYVNPSTYFLSWNEHQRFLIYFVVAVFNLLLFFITNRNILHAPVIKYASFFVFHALMLILTVSDEFPTYGFWMNFLYGAILVYRFFYYYKKQVNKTMMILYGFIGSVYVLIKGLELLTNYFGELFLFFLLGFVALLIFGSIKLLDVIKSHAMNHVIKTIIIVSVTLVATVFATAAIVGLLFLMINDLSLVALFFIAVIVLVIPAIFIKWQAPMRYTLLSTGYVIAVGASSFEDAVFLKIILIGLLGFTWYKVEAKGMKIFHYTLLNIVFGTLIFTWTKTFDFIWLTFLVTNSVVYIFQTKDKASQNTAFLFALGSFISLTMVGEDSTFLSLLYNIVFFLTVTVLVFSMKKRDKGFEFIVSMIFWFLFIGYKYYDLAWELIHKSLLFLALGLIFLAIAALVEKKNFKSQKETSFVSGKWLPILVVIVLQFGFVGYQANTNETLLKEGVSVKLALAPVDPRSLLQGDYVVLRYDISTISEIDRKAYPNEVIKVVLRKTETGVFDYAGFYQLRGKWNKRYEESAKDVIINGRLSGSDNVVYGIESYFVPEGTGLDLQENARFAYVKVGKNGNAILERISRE